MRDQGISPRQAAYNYSVATAAGFLAANGIVQAYGEPFGIGAGPRDANSEVTYRIAFAETAAEVFQQPFLFERIAFLNQFPNNEAKALGVQWGKAVGRRICETRTNDGSEPSEVNYYLGRYRPTVRCVVLAPDRFVLRRHTGSGICIV
ncbi:hypothetical protein [Candidatus Synechococcus spongiarum]|uniref:Uncharacterized protein n=1 Tax=Candidatus Synechococcus spongiarum TaxID=431041 RepID=A0A164Z696_9SYNE|nr:hypothetical protein [Candidatus Synechococcus spongiarum]SAY39276.1 hypothetical protein FLM9_1346 [Candidatus Synechococcus spongiarum]